MTPKVRVTGHARQVQERIRELTRSSLAQAADELLARSQERVPVDTGELRDSGATDVTSTPSGSTATIGYAAPHAVEVHEDLTAVRRSGEAKFLERTELEERQRTIERLRRDLKAGL